MANTILQSFIKWVDGLLLYESFESTNFMLDQAWNLLNGQPTISNLVAEEGIRSLALDLTYPYIEKDFTPSGAHFGVSSVWFFDDAGVVTGGFTPWVEWESDNGQLWGLGVDLSVSTDFYTVMNNGVKTASSVARSDGFHKFLFIFVPSSLLGLIIDGTSVGGIISPTANAFAKMRLGVRDASGTIAFGYFDVAICALNVNLKFYGFTDGTVLSLYEEDDTFIQTVTVASGLGSFVLVNSDSPITGYLVARDAGGAPIFRSAITDFNLGDVYRFSVYDFGRKPSDWGFVDADMRNDLKSIQGVKQSVFFNDSDRVTMTFVDLTEAQKNALDAWWSTAKRGANFAVAIRDNETYFDVVQVDNFDPTSGKVTVLNTDSLAGSQQLVIRDNDGYTKQTVVVDTIDGTDPFFTLDAAPANPILEGQQVRSLYYWPFCTTTQASMQALISNLTLNYWTVTIAFEEAIQP